ncbi:MAG: XdhC family protein [Alphaproteobacteria bacterium]
MPLSYHHPLDVMRFAATQSDAGRAVALIVAKTITGGTLRAPGALMCVSDNGESAGYMSNGCVDADIMSQARQAITDGKPRGLVYGEGSPFKDIILPCGGAIDIWIWPRPDVRALKVCVSELDARRSHEIVFGPSGFSHRYTPKLRLRIAGRGEAVRALAVQAIGAGFEVITQSPDAEILSSIDGIIFDHLTGPTAPPPRPDDPWTAFILMFHDHDWEPAFLLQALEGNAFYIGAMGSPRTQAARKEMLRGRGITAEEIRRIKGPIGLIPSMRDANLLALSTLADIVRTAQDEKRL